MFNEQKCADKLLVLGRVLMAVIFLFAGWGKLTGFAGASAYIGTVFPMADVVTVLTIAIEIGGGLMLLLGYKTKWAAAVLAGFTLLAGALFHNNFADQTQMIMFMKNLAMVGGLLYMYVFGAGSMSCDAKCAKKEMTSGGMM